MSMSSDRDSNVRSTGQDRKHGPPRTIQHMIEMRMFATEVCDENGVKRRVLAFKVGDSWYHDPAAESWFDRLKQVDKNAWLAKALAERFAEANAPATAVPSEDKVDILGGG